MKKAVPNKRSNVISAKATVKTGKAKMIITQVISVVQVNIGIRHRVMPFVRIFRMVTIKLIPVRSVPIPAI